MLKGGQAFLVSCLIGVAAYFFFNVPGWRCVIVTILGFLGLGGQRPTYLFIKNLPRDVQ